MLGASYNGAAACMALWPITLAGYVLRSLPGTEWAVMWRVIPPTGNEIEDYLDPIGLSLEQFCGEMTGGWLFGFTEALKLQGWRRSALCVSRNVGKIQLRIHAPTGAAVGAAMETGPCRHLPRQDRHSQKELGHSGRRLAACHRAAGSRGFSIDTGGRWRPTRQSCNVCSTPRPGVASRVYCRSLPDQSASPCRRRIRDGVVAGRVSGPTARSRGLGTAGRCWRRPPSLRSSFMPKGRSVFSCPVNDRRPSRTRCTDFCWTRS